MKILLTSALAFLVSTLFVGTVSAQTPKKVLVVSVTVGFRHDSISTAEQVLEQLGKESGAFTVDFVRQPDNPPKAPKKAKESTEAEEAAYKVAEAKYKEEQKTWNEKIKENLTKLSAESLKNYDGVIFANTTGDLPLPDNQALIDWVKKGGAFIGMHSASDTFHGFPPYIEMLGGEFLGHGAQATVDCLNQDPKHPACSHLGSVWNIHDEIYLLKNFDRSRVHGLLTLDKHPNSKEPGDYPIAWCRNVGSGRVFYTSLGHRIDVWQKDIYQKHVLGGIKWALGLAPGDGTPQKAKE